MIGKMYKNYLEKTNLHIETVKRVATFLLNHEGISKKIPVAELYFLVHRCDFHDRSKFEIEEQLGYILLNEFYQKKVNYKFLKDDHEIMNVAWEHHKKHNRHHPQFFDDLNQMETSDLLEMICDIAAIAIELDVSLVEYVQTFLYKKFKFNSKQIQLIDFLTNIIHKEFLNNSDDIIQGIK